MMRWWLDRGVDGFRMDVINFISKDPALPDGRVVAGAAGGTAPDGLADGTASYVCGPRIHEFLAEMHREVFADRPGTFLSVGEMPGVTVDEARLFTDPGRGEVDMVFQFEHVQVDQGATKWDHRPLHLPALKAIMARWQAGLADVGWNSLYWCNHDQPRVVSRFGDDGAHPRRLREGARHRAAPPPRNALRLPGRGTRDGERARSPNRQNSATSNPSTTTAAAWRPAEIQPRSWRRSGRVSRDNARTPMQWNGGPDAGFTTGRDAVDRCGSRPCAGQRGCPAGRPRLGVRALPPARRAPSHEPVVALGDFTMLLPDDEAVYAFTRELDGVRLLVLAHWGAGEVKVDVPDGAAWADAEVVLASGSGQAPARVGTDGTWRPGPWDAVVLRLPH